MVGATLPLWIPALTLTPALSQREREIAELWGWELRVPSVRPGLISLTGATYPGSESGTCFRANRWRRFCLPPPLWIPAFAGMTNWGAGMTSAGGTILRVRFENRGLSLPPGSESGMCFRANDDVRFADY